jgi:hypothetical protein
LHGVARHRNPAARIGLLQAPHDVAQPAQRPVHTYACRRLRALEHIGQLAVAEIARPADDHLAIELRQLRERMPQQIGTLGIARWDSARRFHVHDRPASISPGVVQVQVAHVARDAKDPRRKTRLAAKPPP